MIDATDGVLQHEPGAAVLGRASGAQRCAAILAAARASGRRVVDEISAKSLVAAHGISVPKGVFVRGPDDGELPRALQMLRPPWVVKVISPEVVHKTEVGGVRTQLNDRPAVAHAMTSMVDRMRGEGLAIEGFLIEETAPAGVEVVIGGVRDASFGWLVMFGLGGIMVEYLQDVAFGIFPLARLDASEMIGALKTATLLDGARGRPAVNREAVVDAVMAIGGEHGLLAHAGDAIAEIDLNPLIASDRGIVAVDVRIVPAHG
jgi:acyl-CoA synthetase (NDP forming)